MFEKLSAEAWPPEKIGQQVEVWGALEKKKVPEYEGPPRSGPPPGSVLNYLISG